MARKKANQCYVIKKGIGAPCICLSWKDTEWRVSGFSGAEYKGFKSLEAAIMFLGIKDPVIHYGNNKKQQHSEAQACYVIENGIGAPCVCKSWTETNRRVCGFSGAVYKKFPSLDAAATYLSAKSFMVYK